MAQSECSLQDAKNSFNTVVDAASKGTPQTVTKRGKPAVVVLPVTEHDRLIGKTKTRPSFIEHLLAIPRDDGEFDRIPIEPRDVEF